MKWIHAMAAAASLLVAATGQDGCPYQRSEPVASSYVNGPVTTCSSGLHLTIQGININKNGVCPTHITITPSHDRSVPNDRATYTKLTRTVPELVVFFDCQMSWALIIPLGHSCQRTGQQFIGAVPFFSTHGCVEPPQQD